MRRGRARKRASRIRPPVAAEVLEDRTLLAAGPLPQFGFAIPISAGGTPTLPQWGHDVAADATGNVYVTGMFAGTVDFDPSGGTTELTSAGSLDVFVAKYDSTGSLVWARGMGGTGSDRGNEIALDGSGNVVVAGEFGGPNATFGSTTLTNAGIVDAFVLKLDNAGNVQWANGYGAGGGDRALGIDADAAGNVYATGHFEEAVNFGGPVLIDDGISDAFVLKLDNTGATVWARALASDAADIGNAIAVDDAGNVYTTGTYRGDIDLDPSPGGEFVVTKVASDTDFFISKLDSNGNFVYGRGYGRHTGNDSGNGIAVTAAGGVYVTGSFVGTVDFHFGASGTFNLSTPAADDSDIFVLHLDAAGDFGWAGQMGVEGSGFSDTGLDIDLDGSGNVYTTGWFRWAPNPDPDLPDPTPDFDPDPVGEFLLSGATPVTGFENIFVSKLNPAGEFVSALAMAGGGAEQGRGIAVTDDFIYTTGVFDGTVDFDPDPAGTSSLTAVDAFDAFVVQLIQPETGGSTLPGSVSIVQKSNGPADTFSDQGAVSGDGRFVAFSSNIDGNFEIFLFEEGVGVTQITSSTSGDSFSPALDFDGSHLAFASWSNEIPGADNADQNVEIFVFELATGAFTQITNTNTPGLHNDLPTLSDDGTRIALISDVNLDNDADAPVGPQINNIFLWQQGVPGFTRVTEATIEVSTFNPRISGDGSRVVFYSDEDYAGQNGDGSSEIFLFTVGAPLPPQQITNSAFSSMYADISADGNRIVFDSQADFAGNNAEGNIEIFLYDVAANQFTQITDGNDFFSEEPVISGDGTRIAFHSIADFTGENGDFNYEVFLFEQGEGFTQLTNDPFEDSFVTDINHVGSRIIFESLVDHTGENADESLEVFAAMVNTNAPVAVDDGVYTVDQDGTLVVGVAGSDAVVHFNFDESNGGTTDALDIGSAPPAAIGDFEGGATRTSVTPGDSSVGSLDLTGTGTRYVTAGDLDEIDALTEMTVTFWLNLRSAPADRDALVSDLPEIFTETTGGWEIQIVNPVSAADFSVGFTVFDGLSGQGLLVPGFGADQEWAFIAATFDVDALGSNFRLFSGDTGSAVVERAHSVGFALTGDPNDAHLRVGSIDVERTPPAWIDDVRIYGRPLTQAELESVRQEGVTPPPSVLDNDIDTDADILTAVLVDDVDHGDLTLNPDGTFTYTPDPGYTGPDSFTYQASDGLFDSNIATVNIMVQAPAGPAPDLAPFHPAFLGWSDSVVVSTVRDTNTDAPSYTIGDALFVDVSWTNSGEVDAAPHQSQVTFGSETLSFGLSQPLQPGSVITSQDLEFGGDFLSAGVYTVSLDVDAPNEVVESDETNNVRTRQITVGLPSNPTILTIPERDVLGTTPGQWLAHPGEILAANQPELFTFTLSAAAGLFLEIAPPDLGVHTLDSLIGLFDAAGQLIASNDNGFSFQGFSQPADPRNSATAAGFVDSALYADLAAGTYYVAVRGAAGTTGDYILRALADTLYSATVPVFNSLVGAADTLYLDFDGHDSGTGDAWGIYTAAPFSLDADDSTFSPADRLAMRNLWLTVAEDFSPFAINVSTVDPGSFTDGNAFRHVITNSTGAIIGDPSTNLLGIALQESYASGGAGNNVAFTFATRHTNIEGGVDAEIMAIAHEQGNTTSHEVGHALNLGHYTPGGAANNWLMVTTNTGLSRKTWTTATNTDGALQNDIAVIGGASNAIGFRTDDHGNSTTAATLLTPNGTVFAAAGVISTISDLDYFQFTVGAGNVTIVGEVDEYVNNLDIKLRLFDSAGNPVGSIADPSDLFDATLTQNLAAGTYFVEVSSNGDAGEAGNFLLVILADAVPTAGFTITESGGDTEVSENSDPGLPHPETDTFTVVLTTQPAPGTLVVLSVTSADIGEAKVNLAQLTFNNSNWDQPQTITVSGINDNLDDGNQIVTVTVAVNDTLTTDNAFDSAADQTVDVTVLNVPVDPTMLGPLTGQTVLNGQVTFTWNDVAGATSYNIWLLNRANPTVVLYSKFDVPPGGTFTLPPADALPPGDYRYFFSANNDNGFSNWSGPHDFAVGAPVVPPAAPTGFSSNGSAPRPTIDWGDVPGAVFYNVWLVNMQTGALVQSATGLTTSSFTPSVDLAATRHRILVRAGNGAGLGPWSAPFDFTVGAPIIVPLAPTGLGAINTDTPQPTIQWNASVGATHYALWFINRTTGAIVSNAANVTATNFTPAADLDNGNYRFFVRAINLAGSSGWAGPFDFSVNTPPPQGLLSMSASGAGSQPSFNPGQQPAASRLEINGAAFVETIRTTTATPGSGAADEARALAAYASSSAVPRLVADRRVNSASHTPTAVSSQAASSAAFGRERGLDVRLVDDVFAADPWLDVLDTL